MARCASTLSISVQNVVLGARARHLEQDVGGALGRHRAEVTPRQLDDGRARLEPFERAQNALHDGPEHELRKVACSSQPEDEHFVEHELRPPRNEHDLAERTRHETQRHEPRETPTESVVAKARDTAWGSLPGRVRANQDLGPGQVETPEVGLRETKIHDARPLELPKPAWLVARRVAPA